MSDESQPPIAVTVVGGYLGAGKTTLVNNMLRAATEPIAVLVNDFGDINIDADLIEQADGETISLANGCICCSLIDGFSAALQTIAAAEPAPSRLVIEASGVADPATVAAYGHGPGLVLDAVVVMADGETVRAKARDKYVGDTVLGQLRSADIVVLNKADLLDTEQLGAVGSWLSDQAPKAVMVTAERAEVPETVLFGAIPSPGGQVSAQTASTPAEGVFESWTWTGSETLDRARVDALMEWLPETVVRAKGVLAIEAADAEGRTVVKRMVLQRVGKRWTVRATPDRDPPGRSQLVVIGLAGAIGVDDLDQRLR